MIGKFRRNNNCRGNLAVVQKSIDLSRRPNGVRVIEIVRINEGVDKIPRLIRTVIVFDGKFDMRYIEIHGKADKKHQERRYDKKHRQGPRIAADLDELLP